MRILKELEDAKLVIVDLEVKLRDKIRSAPTLCAKYKGKIFFESLTAFILDVEINSLKSF